MSSEEGAEAAAGRCVRLLWESFEARDWDRAAACLADDFVSEWPQTGERFRGRANFIAMNKAHPAPNWHIRIRRLVATESTAAAEVVVPTDDGVDVCLGFYDVSDGMIRHGVEYWSEHGVRSTPAWRAAFSERMIAIEPH